VLFIKNVPYDVEDSELEELVAPYGDVSAVRVGIDSGTGRTKGCGRTSRPRKVGFSGDSPRSPIDRAGPVSRSFAYVEMAKKADAIKAVEAARAKPFVLRGRALAVVCLPTAHVRMRRRSS